MRVILMIIFGLSLSFTKLVAQKLPDSALSRLLQSDEEAKLQIQSLNKQVADLKMQVQKQQRIGYDKFTNTSLFLDAAISSANSLQALISKESYRNKIVSLNNPTSNELGFSLEMEIQNAMKPLLAKAKKTNTNKFGQVVGSFLNTGKSGLSLFPAGNVFTSIVGMAGNLTVQEKAIEQKDLDDFIKSIEKYFNQYERLYQSNLRFNNDIEKLKTRLRLLQSDIKLLIQDLVLALDKSVKRHQLKNISTEELMLRYFDSNKILEQLSKGNNQVQYPLDAIKTCKEIANSIQRIYDEYSAIYNSNFKEIRSIISDTKNVSAMVNQIQLNQTLGDVEALYSESKTLDADNLRLKTLFDRLEVVIQ
jgi:hypothetical protein